MFRNWFAALALGASAGSLLVTPAVAEEARLIIKLQPDGAQSALTPKARIAKASGHANITARHLRAMSVGADVVAVTPTMLVIRAPFTCVAPLTVSVRAHWSHGLARAPFCTIADEAAAP